MLLLAIAKINPVLARTTTPSYTHTSVNPASFPAKIQFFSDHTQYHFFERKNRKQIKNKSQYELCFMHMVHIFEKELSETLTEKVCLTVPYM